MLPTSARLTTDRGGQGIVRSIGEGCRGSLSPVFQSTCTTPSQGRSLVLFPFALPLMVRSTLIANRVNLPAAPGEDGKQ